MSESAAIREPDTETRTGFEEYSRAILNILDDFASEKERLGDTQRAILNVLEDFAAEKVRLESTQKAILNILEDFDEEKNKVEQTNRDLLQEVADRREAQQALTSSNAELEQFAYVASHDLQEPLRMVSSYVQLFEKRYRSQIDDQADKYIGYAVEGAKRMQSLIGGLLEYSRMGRQEGEATSQSLETTLEQALANIRSAVDETNAHITHDALPAVTADHGQLARVLQNLVGNALKFRRPDVAPEVHISAQQREADWLFSVQDNGIGIEPQYAQRIFVIFQRLHTRLEYPGTGIGLSICKKIIERHGGQIWVEPGPEQGSIFRFTLPVYWRERK